MKNLTQGYQPGKMKLNSNPAAVEDTPDHCEVGGQVYKKKLFDFTLRNLHLYSILKWPHSSTG